MWERDAEERRWREERAKMDKEKRRQLEDEARERVRIEERERARIREVNHKCITIRKAELPCTMAVEIKLI